MVRQRSGWLLAAAGSLWAASAGAQTITISDKTVAADESNVYPIVRGSSGGSKGFESVQLTDDVLAELTDRQLSNVDLFYFDGGDEVQARGNAPRCKIHPEDASYPNETVWNVLDSLTGGGLIKTVPLGSACYEGPHYDAEKCTFLVDHWNASETHIDDPTSVMSPLYEGTTCEPGGAAMGKTCTLGGFPTYSLNISTVADIQLGINFARNQNLRLVVRNTGHDFLGKNTGEGALSLWTHNHREIEVLRDYESAGGRYKGPAFKLGPGVMVHEIYEAAEREGYTAVGGECHTVGMTGGYLGGGGHSPVTPIYGLGSDQVLSVDVVTPDGRFITADETQNKDLFWAIRGGGAATWGVVTSMTVKVHEKMVFSGMTWQTTTKAMNVSDDVFWEAVAAYWRRYPEFSAAKTYGYCRMSAEKDGGYAWRGLPVMVPGMKLADFKKLAQPLLDEWAALGVDPKVEFFEHDSLYQAWDRHFPTAIVARAYGRTANRLLPRKNWEDAALMNKTIQTVRSVVEDGAFLVHYNINAEEPDDTPDSAANPAWRDVMMFNIIGLSWDAETPQAEIDDINDKLTNDLNQRLKDISPGSGGYLNEGDVMDVDFAQSFYGSNYERLLEIKGKVDPKGVFWAPTAVGSEDWYLTNQNKYVTKQIGRLCRR